MQHFSVTSIWHFLPEKISFHKLENLLHELVIFPLWEKNIFILPIVLAQPDSKMKKMTCSKLPKEVRFSLMLFPFSITRLLYQFLVLFIDFGNPASNKHGIRQEFRSKILPQDAASLQDMDTTWLRILVVYDGCHFHCGDDWVIFQSRVHFVGQVQQRWTHKSTVGISFNALKSYTLDVHLVLYKFSTGWKFVRLGV